MNAVDSLEQTLRIAVPYLPAAAVGLLSDGAGAIGHSPTGLSGPGGYGGGPEEVANCTCDMDFPTD